jgi:hypothetical protein
MTDFTSSAGSPCQEHTRLYAARTTDKESHVERVALTFVLLAVGFAHAAGGVVTRTLACHVDYSRRQAQSKAVENGSADIRVLVSTGKFGGEPVFIIEAPADRSLVPFLMWISRASSGSSNHSLDGSTDTTWVISRSDPGETEEVRISRVSGVIQYVHQFGDSSQGGVFARFTGSCNKAPPPKLKF